MKFGFIVHSCLKKKKKKKKKKNNIQKSFNFDTWVTFDQGQ